MLHLPFYRTNYGKDYGVKGIPQIHLFLLLLLQDILIFMDSSQEFTNLLRFNGAAVLKDKIWPNLLL